MPYGSRLVVIRREMMVQYLKRPLSLAMFPTYFASEQRHRQVYTVVKR